MTGEGREGDAQGPGRPAQRGRRGEQGGAADSELAAGADAAGRPSGGPPQAVAALRMEQLLLWVVGRADDFPRSHRFTIADRWIETCLQVQTSLLEASYSRHKAAALAQASTGLIRARVLARLARQLRALSPGQEAYFAQQSVQIGKMIGGWQRSARVRAERSQRDVPPQAQR